MKIYAKLSKIQNELKVPKNQRNTFGNYNYRSAEDILEAVKPICAKHETTLIVSDEMSILGDRVYIVSTATLYTYDGESVSAKGSAREALTKKGMDDSQITGSTSSYARKYALNGLFNIDDTKDADSWNKHGKDETPKKKAPYQPSPNYTPPKTEKEMFDIAVRNTKQTILSKLDKEEYSKYKGKVLSKLCSMYKVDSFNDIVVKNNQELEALKNNVGSKLEIVKLEEKGDI